MKCFQHFVKSTPLKIPEEKPVVLYLLSRYCFFCLSVLYMESKFPFFVFVYVHYTYSFFLCVCVQVTCKYGRMWWVRWVFAGMTSGSPGHWLQLPLLWGAEDLLGQSLKSEHTHPLLPHTPLQGAKQEQLVTKHTHISRNQCICFFSFMEQIRSIIFLKAKAGYTMPMEKGC